MSDEDLTSFLTEELERSRKRKEGIKDKPAKSSDDAIETAAKSDFKPVNDSDDVIEIDLSSYDIDSYSKRKEKQEQNKAAPTRSQKPKPEPKPKPAKVKKEKPPKPKKERKKLPVWLPITAAAAVVLLSLLLGGYYLYDYNGVFGLFAPQDSTSIAEDISHQTSDSTAASEEKDAGQISEQDSLDVPEEEIEEVEPIEETDIAEEPKEEIVAETPRHTSKPISRSNRDFSNVPKVKTQTEANDNKTISRDQPDVIKNTKDLPFSFDENERGVFTVQIYSTLSEDDALDWLLKLKQKNIGSAFISQQKIRDKVWYRVRFGAYQTERDAKEAAAKYGFAQSWIDRVK
jgi:cell division septation protein DedD